MTYAYSDLGLDLSELIGKGGPAIDAVSKVIQDPALPEITCLVLRLNKLTERKPPGALCAHRPYTAEEKRKGVGLTRVVMPLRAAVWARENPIAAAGVGAAALLAVAGIGYYVGKGSKK